MYEDERLPPLEDLPPADHGLESRFTHVGEGDAYSPLQPEVIPQRDLEDEDAARANAAVPPTAPEPPQPQRSGLWNRVPAGYVGGTSPRAVRWVTYIFWIVEILLAIRIFLKLLAANPLAIFSTLIYGITWPFVAPFTGVFPSPSGAGHELDAAAILALAIYPLIAWAIVRLIELWRRRSSSTT